MNAKRPRDGDVPNHPPIAPPPPRQMALQVDYSNNVGEALPTLTNWGGGRSEGSKVVSNARLTNQQRSTIQRAVCSYFLQNKFVPLSYLYGFISLSRAYFYICFIRCRKGADCPYSHDADVPKQQDM
jgi:hypothetical protein